MLSPYGLLVLIVRLLTSVNFWITAIFSLFSYIYFKHARRGITYISPRINLLRGFIMLVFALSFIYFWYTGDLVIVIKQDLIPL